MPGRRFVSQLAIRYASAVAWNAVACGLFHSCFWTRISFARDHGRHARSCSAWTSASPGPSPGPAAASAPAPATRPGTSARSSTASMPGSRTWPWRSCRSWSSGTRRPSPSGGAGTRHVAVPAGSPSGQCRRSASSGSTRCDGRRGTRRTFA
ncbi:hypothetical protein PBRA_009664 [Plasmodiophora brassicae]|uniref:Uncharacterized protein n=1 Tax=Plasmodiophora brassicae TaxID=37360 RepID=A0A0G4IJY3_PLABS|nr:hypothetical protein PBRA_009664 [Plasmodiophora brassicae]